MSKNISFETRMKTFYEEIPKNRLMRRTPVIIRLDGKAFHTFTKHLRRPFDEVFQQSMDDTMKYLCENIQGCVFGYTQSDEITLVLVDYKKLTSDAWFNYEIQKICSISASMATLAFNQAFRKHAEEVIDDDINTYPVGYSDVLASCIDRGAMFDSRCFNIPKEEVANVIYWRQHDAIRNSIQMVGQTYFSQCELAGKNLEQIKRMLVEERGVSWEFFPARFKRGSCCIYSYPGWTIDRDIPLFVGENREYIEQWIEPEE